MLEVELRFRGNTRTRRVLEKRKFRQSTASWPSARPTAVTSVLLAAAVRSGNCSSRKCSDVQTTC